MRLIDADMIKFREECCALGNGVYEPVLLAYSSDICCVPPIDLEALPIVKELRKSLEKSCETVRRQKEELDRRDKVIHELEKQLEQAIQDSDIKWKVALENSKLWKNQSDFLQDRLAKVTAERDAAVYRIRQDHWCEDCENHNIMDLCGNECDCDFCGEPCYCENCHDGSLWAWRGLKKER